MNSLHMKRLLFEIACGAIGQSNINSRELRALSVALPPIDLQRQFTVKTEVVRGIVVKQAIALATVQATFDALLHQAFV